MGDEKVPETRVLTLHEARHNPEKFNFDDWDLISTIDETVMAQCPMCGTPVGRLPLDTGWPNVGELRELARKHWMRENTR
jgi:hypothetical protein